jgi:galactonate dehydratase
VLGVTLKNLFARKLRLVLTSIAVVLGVAFISGTFVLTDTLGSVFDNLFTETTKGIDAVVRTKRALDDDQPGRSSRNPVPNSLVSVVESAPGVQAAHGFVQGFATIVGKDGDIGIDFHGAIGPATAKILMKELDPLKPFFYEEIINAQNVDVMAELAKATAIPIATGERIFTKWGFREILEKGAATILQPDLCHAGGITEVRLIAGMAEAYYANIAPHNPLGPISLAAGLQIAASIPNFLCQEQVSLGEGYIKNPFKVREGYVDLPTGPGLGIELDEVAMKDKIGHDWRNPETYDPDDGSVVDW